VMKIWPRKSAANFLCVQANTGRAERIYISGEHYPIPELTNRLRPQLIHHQIVRETSEVWVAYIQKHRGFVLFWHPTLAVAEFLAVEQFRRIACEKVSCYRAFRFFL
jgi:hypothetical protein